MSDGTDRAATHARPLIVSGDRRSYQVQRVLGWVLLVAFGITFLLSALIVLLVVAVKLLTAVASDDPSGLAVPVLALALPLLASGVLSLVGYGAWREVRELDRLRLRIDERGIARESAPPLHLPWDRIRHLMVTRHRQGMRRLIVDDGTGPELRPSDATGSLRAVFSRRGEFTLNVPVDRLDVTAEQVIQAISHHSGQRLPDL